MPDLLYLHGFDSAPTSEKAQLVRAYMQQQYPEWGFICPQLPNLPEQALAIAQQARTQQTVALMGSSMGGFYATYLAETYGLPAVLINPAVRPDRLLQGMLGPHRHPHTGVEVALGEQHVRQLQRQEIAVCHPERYRVYLQTGDEILDYRLAAGKYAACQLVIEPGGDHSFVDFESKLAEIFEFLLAAGL